MCLQTGWSKTHYLGQDWETILVKNDKTGTKWTVFFTRQAKDKSVSFVLSVTSWRWNLTPQFGRDLSKTLMNILILKYYWGTYKTNILQKLFWTRSSDPPLSTCQNFSAIKNLAVGRTFPPPFFLDNIKYFVSFFLLVWQWHVNFGYGCDFGLAEEGQT